MLLLLVLGSTLFVASGVFDGSPPTRADRAARLEASIKCPACEGLSVAQSNAPSAIAVRHEIEAAIRRGASDGEITASLVATYGPTIVLIPPKRGLTAVLWLAPVVVVIGSCAVFIALMRKRRRP
ncbi:MAG: cytochrome c-type biogenesis protein CcmH [Actinomycetota bacterium]